MTILRVIDWINTNFAGELVASPSPMNSFGLNEPCSWAAQIQVTGNNGLSVGIAPMGIAHPLDRGDGEERVKLMFRADMETFLSLPRTILHRFVAPSGSLSGQCSICGQPFRSYCHSSPEHQPKTQEQLADEYYRPRTHKDYHENPSSILPGRLHH